MKKVAALFVITNGPYFGLDSVEPWDETRDARKYSGPFPVVAHPPCERWGRYWSGGPSAKIRRKLGDDNGCFLSALKFVRKYGGVLEHPEASKAYDQFGIVKPPRSGGWVPAGHLGGYVCCVEQGHYGHPARKATWIYAYKVRELAKFKWGPSRGIRLDEGFHSKEERKRAREAGIKPIKRLSKKQNTETPVHFRNILIDMAMSVNTGTGLLDAWPVGEI